MPVHVLKLSAAVDVHATTLPLLLSSGKEVVAHFLVEARFEASEYVRSDFFGRVIASVVSDELSGSYELIILLLKDATACRSRRVAVVGA